MGKMPVSADWFNYFHTRELREQFMWLERFANTVERIADFGCWTGSEPFALLWTLDAREVVVVEQNKAHLDKPKEHLANLQNVYPDSLSGRSVRFVVADMTSEMPELPPSYFDLAYCADVLYQIERDRGMKSVEHAVRQMAQCVGSDGLLVVVEPKIGADFDLSDRGFGGVPIQTTAPIDISSFFEAEGLSRCDWDVPPSSSIYCYRKP